MLTAKEFAFQHIFVNLNLHNLSIWDFLVINISERTSRWFYLQPSSTQLFYRHIDFLRWILCTLDHALINTPKPALSYHDASGEILGGRLELWDRELFKVAGSLQYYWKISSPSRWFCTGLGSITRIEVRIASLHFTISRWWNDRLGPRPLRSPDLIPFLPV